MDVNTFLCISCSLDEFMSLAAPPGFEKTPVHTLQANTAELRKLPTDDHFIGFTDDAGHEYQNDARFASPLSGSVTLPCGIPGREGYCGLMIELESDRTFVYSAGETIHELGDGTVTYLLYAVCDASNLAAMRLPGGWSYAARALDRELVVDPEGFPHVYQDVQGNLWQKVGARTVPESK
jgi:hypothetical protein